MNNCPYQLCCGEYNTEQCPEDVINCENWKRLAEFDESKLTHLYTDCGLVRVLEGRE